MRNAVIAVLFSLLSVSSNPLLLAQDKLLTLEEIYGTGDEKIAFSGESMRGLTWMKDGLHYLERGEKGVMLKVDANSGTSENFYSDDQLSGALAALPGFDEASAGDFLKGCRKEVTPGEEGLLLSCSGDLFHYAFADSKMRRVTSDTAEEEYPEMSPSGQMVAYIKDYDLHISGILDGRERNLTEGGTTGKRNGMLDWVYQEEVYGRGTYRAYWWSPDSRRLAFLQVDGSAVPEFSVVDHIPTHLDVEISHYPKAGDPNPKARLGIVSVLDGNLKWVDLSQYEIADFLIVHVGWTPDSQSVVFQIQDRQQTWLELNKASVKSGKREVLLREDSEAWVDRLDEPRWLEDGSFLWRSQRTGYAHLYHYSAEGKLLAALTEGEWEVRRVLRVDKNAKAVYFTGSKDSVIEGQLYRVGLDGGEVTKISDKPGSHSANFNEQATLFIDSWSDAVTPTQISLREADGKLIRTISENEVKELKDYKLGPVEFLQVPTRDGFVMEAMMIKPPDFDPSKKYPVMSYTYSGPHSQSVSNRWGGTGYMWNQLLAQKGFIIWVCDNRTSSGKGMVSAWKGYRNLGELELRDLEDGLTWLKSQPYVDGERIGLWGWSYGGYMTSYALTHSKSFKIGIAGAPVTDWSLYDSIYTERYMGMPQNNPEGYKKSSVVQAAGDLHGKLLLIHGTMDDNVHMQNSIQLIIELQKAGKDFRFMAYPKSRHGVRDPKQVMHLRQMMTNFILENL